MDMVEKAIEVLNSALEADKQAMIAMFNHRVFCNSKLAEHPTIQVRDHSMKNDETKEYSFSILGLINGLFGIDEDGWGFIVMEADLNTETGQIVDIVRFLNRKDMEKGV